jgi:NADH-quinone oxidoreductase subunit E
MGGDQIFATLKDHLGIGHDETTDDGTITLEHLECNAACDYAPVVMVNWEFFDNQTPATAREVVDRIRAGRTVAPSRGANTVATFKQVSKVLAGFDDGRANEGVSAGTPSQRGTVLAGQMGWSAPRADGRDDDSATAGAGPDAERTTRGHTASAARDVKARGAGSSGSDAPAVPAGTAERAGTTAGKPPGEATEAKNDPGTGTQKEG